MVTAVGGGWKAGGKRRSGSQDTPAARRADPCCGRGHPRRQLSAVRPSYPFSAVVGLADHRPGARGERSSTDSVAAMGSPVADGVDLSALMDLARSAPPL